MSERVKFVAWGKVDKRAPARSESARPETDAPPDRTSEPVRKGVAPVSAPPVSARAESDPQWTAYTNRFWDEIVPTLRPADAVVLGQLWRLTVGFNRERCTIGVPKLGKRCGLSRNPLREAIERLELRGLIRRVTVDNTSVNADKGTVFEVLLARPVLARPKSARPETARAESAPMISDHKQDQSAVYRLREMAVKIREASGYSPERLEEAVRDAATGQGIEYTAGELAEALRPLVKS